MTTSYGSTPPTSYGSAPSAPPTDESTTRDQAREQAGQVASHAQSSAADVKDSAVSAAQDVASEAKAQVQDLLGQTRETLTQHANDQTTRLGETLRRLADELHEMASNADQSGPAASLVREVADRVHGAAGRVEGRQATDLLDDVRRFARRRPGAFLLSAAGLGFVAGRLGRGIKDASSQSQSSSWGSGQALTEPYPSDDFGTGSVVTGTGYPGVAADPDVTGGPATGAGLGTPVEPLGGTGPDVSSRPMDRPLETGSTTNPLREPGDPYDQ